VKQHIRTTDLHFHATATGQERERG